MGFSTRSRVDAERYAAAETQKVKQQQQVDAEKAVTDQRLQKFWGGDVATIKQYLSAPAAIDKFSGLSLVADRKAHVDGAVCDTVLNKLFVELEAEGTTLTETAKERLACYGVCHAQIFADMTNIDNWRRAFNRLQELRAFAAGDVLTVAKPAAPQAKKPETLNDVYTQLDQVSTQSREGDKRAKRLATEGLILEAQPVYRRFKAHIEHVFLRIITAQEADQCIDYIRRNNLRLDDPKSWDKVRVKVLKCVTQEEIDSMQMDVDADTLSSRDFVKKYGLRQGSATLGY